MHATNALRRRVKTLDILASGAFVLSSLGVAKAAEQPVNWTHQVNVVMRGNSIDVDAISA